MARHWTFGQKVGAGFAVMVAMTLLIALVSASALRGVVESKDRVITVHAENLVEAERLVISNARKGGAVRGFLLDRNERHAAEVRAQREAFRTGFDRLRARAANDAERALLDRVAQGEAEYHEAAERVMALRRSEGSLERVARVFDEDFEPRRESLRAALGAYTAHMSRTRDEAKAAASAMASSAITLVTTATVGALLFSVLMAVLLTRSLGTRIGTAVSQVQSSSAELQAAATQQASGAREQSTAMNEITTTISELLATSRQIAESAQRVAQVAKQTSASAHNGGGTVDSAHESIAGIRRQVDIIVGHMLDLGKKSQQIGAVLEIVSELAEQTNILSINATIEATGAGEAGKRFAVVADEIRKLADRVAASTKEIRTLIDEVRGAVNTTVMATETGAKAVGSGSDQFGQVAEAFKHIAQLVTTTMEAAREIELSTKQQTTAVEQVNVAITNVAQATKETEASSGQTLQTASQLAGLSKDLLRLVQAEAGA